MDTYPGRIPGVSVSDTYPTRDTHLPYRIRVSEYQTLLRLWLGERPRPKPHRPVIHTGLSWLAWLAG